MHAGCSVYTHELVMFSGVAAHTTVPVIDLNAATNGGQFLGDCIELFTEPQEPQVRQTFHKAPARLPAHQHA